MPEPRIWSKLLRARRSSGTFVCAVCKGEFSFDPSWSEEDALAEMHEKFGDVPESDRRVICDDCFKMIEKDEMHSELADAIAELVKVHGYATVFEHLATWRPALAPGTRVRIREGTMGMGAKELEGQTASVERSVNQGIVYIRLDDPSVWSLPIIYVDESDVDPIQESTAMMDAFTKHLKEAGNG